MGLVAFIAIGAVAGWLAGQIMKGAGLGLVKNVIIGIVGAFLGGLVLGLIGIDLGGFIGSLITATIGAVLLLFILNKLQK